MFEDIRKEIDKIDEILLENYEKRLDCIRKIATLKFENNIEVLDQDREIKKLNDIKGKTKNFYNIEYTEKFFINILDESKKIQKKQIKKLKEK